MNIIKITAIVLLCFVFHQSVGQSQPFATVTSTNTVINNPTRTTTFLALLTPPIIQDFACGNNLRIFNKVAGVTIVVPANNYLIVGDLIIIWSGSSFNTTSIPVNIDFKFVRCL